MADGMSERTPGRRNWTAREIGRIMPVEPGVGPIVMARPENAAAMLAALRTYGVDADLSGDRLRLPISI